MVTLVEQLSDEYVPPNSVPSPVQNSDIVPLRAASYNSCSVGKENPVQI